MVPCLFLKPNCWSEIICSCPKIKRNLRRYIYSKFWKITTKLIVLYEFAVFSGLLFSCRSIELESDVINKLLTINVMKLGALSDKDCSNKNSYSTYAIAPK